MSEVINVLIAENDIPLQEIMTRSLERETDIHVVCTVEDGALVCDSIKSFLPDVVLLDILMPGMDGISILKMLNGMQLEKMPETIVVSAVAHDKVMKDAAQLGIRNYLIKPFDMEYLIRQIRNAVKKAK